MNDYDELSEKEICNLLRSRQLIPYIPYSDDMELAFKDKFAQMTKAEKKQLYLSFILKGAEMPVFMTTCNDIDDYRMEFKDLYLHPFSVKLNGVTSPFLRALSFAQFLSLRQMYHSDDVFEKAPLINCPPEYWYLFSMCSSEDSECIPNVYDADQIMTIESGQARYQFIAGASYVVTAPRKSFTSAFAKLFGPLAKPFVNSRQSGPDDLPQFLLSLPKVLISRDCYMAWTSYWEVIRGMKNNNMVASFISAHLDIAAPLARTNDLPAANFEVSVTEKQYVIVNENELVADCEKKEVLVHPASELLKVDRVFDNALGLTNPCPGKGCCDDMWLARALEVYGPEQWPAVFRGRMLNVPSFLAEVAMREWDAQRTYMQVLSGKQEFMVASNDFIGADVQWKPPMLSDPNVHGGFADVDVLAHKQIWHDYIKVDAIVARFAGTRFYGYRPNQPPIVQYEVLKMNVKKEGLGNVKAKVPSTFTKFAHLFVAFGYVSLVQGDYPVGSCPALGNKNFLEFSAAPYGAMMAAMEAGICTKYFYTRFSGEHSSEPPYNANIMDFFSGMPNQATDLKGIAKSLQGGNITLKFSMLIVDVPLHRNSNAALSGKGIGLLEHARELEEFVDDIPLARGGAMTVQLTYIRLYAEKLLQEGGDMIVKVIDTWSVSAVEGLWLIARNFSSVEILKSPYSKFLSKESYFCFKSYGGAPVLTEIEFWAMLYSFNNVSMCLLNSNYIIQARRYGGETRVERAIVCRKQLYKKRAAEVGLVVPLAVDYQERDWGAPVRLPRYSSYLQRRGVPATVIVAPGVLDKDCENEALHLTEKTNETLNSLIRYVTEENMAYTYKDLYYAYMAFGKDARKMLKKVEEWRDPFEIARLVERFSVTPQTAALTLFRTNGDGNKAYEVLREKHF